MKQKLNWGLLVLLAGCTHWSAAQGLSDVMLYSRQDPMGTARSMGMGGAMTGLGADLGAIWSNPAGLGMYRSSDLAISLGVGAGGASTAYLGNRSVAAEPHIIVGQLGAALTMPLSHPDWKRGTFAIGYTPLKDFHQRAEWKGETDGNSITGQFAAQAQGTSFDSLWYFFPFDAELAWYTYMIDTLPGSTDQYAPAFSSDRVEQSLRRDRTGRMGETTVAFGTTWREMLHIGFAVGVVSADMERIDVYRESKVLGPSTMEQLTLNDRLEISGSGAYWSAGLIFQPERSPLRLGWSYRSGTVLSVDDFYQVDASARFSGSGSFEASSPSSFVQYRIRTPRRHQFGLSWTMGKAAVLSLDYGRSDYGTSTFTSNDFFEEDVAAIQRRIDTTLRMEQLFRGGIEFRVDDEWRIRCGGGWRSAASDPLENVAGTPDGSLLEDGADALHWAFGGEYRNERWYGGATYRHASTADARRLYGMGPEVATGRTGLGMLMLTLGARY